LKDAIQHLRVLDDLPIATGYVQDGRFAYVNDAAAIMHGYPGAKSMIGLESIECIYEPDRERLESYMKRRLSGDSTVPDRYETIAIRSDETTFPMEVYAKTDLFDGKPAVLFVSKDISAKKEMEIELKRKARETALYSDILIHDMGNINQTSLTNLDLLLSTDFGELNEDQTSFAETCKAQTLRAGALIDRIRTLVFTKNSKDITYTPVDLTEVLTCSIHSAETLQTERAVVIKFEEVKGRFVLADYLIHRLFNNLVQNSVLHNASQKIQVKISVDEGKIEKTPCWRISVEDNGPGIPDENKSEIFTRFAPCGGRQGRGLGLAIVRTLTAKYCGRVTIEDRVQGDPAQGARFVVLLPKA
jgi:PAS domain S-box-containing protein